MMQCTGVLRTYKHRYCTQYNRMYEEKNNFNFEKCAIFWYRLSITPYINVTRIQEILISYVKLDHTFHQNKYGSYTHTYIHTQVQRICYTFLLYSGLTQACPELRLGTSNLSNFLPRSPFCTVSQHTHYCMEPQNSLHFLFSK